MATWDPAAPALADDIASDLGKMRDNFAIIGTAWSGDHEPLATNGTDSQKHLKLTMPALAADPARADSTGFLYTKNSGGGVLDTDLYYQDSANLARVVQLTKGGKSIGAESVWAFGNAHSWDTVTGVVTNGKNVTSITRTNDNAHSYQSVTVNFSTLLITTITGITATNPAKITTAANHNLVDNDSVMITGLTGGTNVGYINNKEWVITKISDTEFTIPVDFTTGIYGANGDISNTYSLTHTSSCDNGISLFDSVAKLPSSFTIRFYTYTVDLVRIVAKYIDHFEFKLLTNR